MMLDWNATAIDCREALQWLDTQLDLPAPVWLSAHAALCTILTTAQKRISDGCESWFRVDS